MRTLVLILQYGIFWKTRVLNSPKVHIYRLCYLWLANYYGPENLEPSFKEEGSFSWSMDNNRLYRKGSNKSSSGLSSPAHLYISCASTGVNFNGLHEWNKRGQMNGWSICVQNVGESRMWINPVLQVPAAHISCKMCARWPK